MKLKLEPYDPKALENFRPHPEPKQYFEIVYPSRPFSEGLDKSMKSYVSVISTPTADTTGSCIILAFDDKKYLFGNVHEGLQRVCTQNRRRFGRISNVFLTGKTEWRTTGGLLGFIITVADVMQTISSDMRTTVGEAQVRLLARQNQTTSLAAVQEMEKKSSQLKDKLSKMEVPEMAIHGGKNIMQMLATARRFIFRRGLPLKIHEYAHNVSTVSPTWEDHHIRVWAMPLWPQNHDIDANGKSSRKRSFDDYSKDNGLSRRELADDGAERLQGIMTDMFDSDWQLDTLTETQLSEVKWPAMIFVRDPETKELKKYIGPVPGDGEDLPDIKVLVRKPWPGALTTELPATKPSPVSISYIVKNLPRRGKFDRELAIKLGVKPGPAFSELTKGATIKTAEGQIVTPERVTGPMIEGEGFAVIELPTAEYISSLKNSTAFQDEKVMKGVEAIFWFLGPGITNDPAFQALVKEHPNRKHIISSVDHCANYLSMDSAAGAQLRHRTLDEARFGMPLFNNATTKLPQDLSDCTIAHRGIILDLSPEVKFTSTMNPGPLNAVEAMGVSKSVKQLSNLAHKELRQPDFIKAYQDQRLPGDDAEIVTLGTGSSVPSKQRNVSATLLRIPNVGSYLLDCGEGTMGQLARIYPADELKKILKNLKLVWISHLHADHHLGLASIIKAWHTAVYGDPQDMKPNEDKSPDQLTDPIKDLEQQQGLCVMAESTMLQWLKEYSEIENFGYNRVVPICVNPTTFDESNNIITPTKFEWNDTSLGFKTADSRVNTVMRKITGLANLQSVYVLHCAGAKAVSMTWPSGLKISYSGDCRPSKRFTIIGRDSTVLIHEATFDDALSGDAEAKRHSTTREAIGVGLEMRAKRIILTHFSQRYSKIPALENVVAIPTNFEDLTNTSAYNIIDPRDRQPKPTPISTEDNFDERTLGSLDSAFGETQYQAPSIMQPRANSTSHDLAVAAREVKIGVAFDHMRVKVKDIIALEKFKPTFQKLYTDYTGTDDDLDEEAKATKKLALKEEAAALDRQQYYDKAKEGNKRKEEEKVQMAMEM